MSDPTRMKPADSRLLVLTVSALMTGLETLTLRIVWRRSLPQERSGKHNRSNELVPVLTVESWAQCKVTQPNQRRATGYDDT